jgi:DNA-binding phage protein
MQIYLVVFDKASYRLSENLFQNVASYIDENYVEQKQSFLRATFGPSPIELDRTRARRAMAMEETAPRMAAETLSLSLEDMLQQEDAGFTEKLLQLIDKTGKKDSEIYKKANLSKQHFSKIRNNPQYKPTKPTAVALALALELNLEDTKDLIGRAGYALSNSSKFDLIIRYFIENRNYNIVEINVVLFEYDQVLLCT